jgi:hypothetical protein
MSLTAATNAAALSLLAGGLLVLLGLATDPGGVSWTIARIVVTLALLATRVARALPARRSAGASRHR